MFRVTPRVVIYPQVLSRALSYSAEILINILRVVSIVPLADSSSCLELFLCGDAVIEMLAVLTEHLS
jgi:hypothetical protein